MAIDAYEQPVSRSDVERIRGVDSSGVIDTLLARGLVVDDTRSGRSNGMSWAFPDAGSRVCLTSVTTCRR
jgi:chromosome segregation and condensation protein ScpB